MIVLYTDFGAADPYVGQVHAVLARDAPGVPVIDLLHTVPRFDVRAGAYLLPALAAEFPSGTVFVCVVDPGVGGSRRPVVLRAGGRTYVGPDNGLFEIVARRAPSAEVRAITWRPGRLSTSFHGRDLFAPAAALLARRIEPESAPAELTPPQGAPWPDDLPQVVYIDHYGNAMTGLRACAVPAHAVLEAAGRRLPQARVFADVADGEAFWYVNSIGLVELAVNRGSAAELLGLRVGSEVSVRASRAPAGGRVRRAPGPA